MSWSIGQNGLTAAFGLRRKTWWRNRGEADISFQVIILRQRCVDVWVGGLDGGQIMPRVQLPAVPPKRRAWNKGRLVGQKRPLLPKQVWAIRARLELAGNLRDIALFNVAIDSKLRGCDLVALKVSDLIRDDRVRERVSVVQSKTNKPVQFELAENTRETVAN
jgi:integrase